MVLEMHEHGSLVHVASNWRHSQKEEFSIHFTWLTAVQIKEFLSFLHFCFVKLTQFIMNSFCKVGPCIGLG
jgi:hypothetical protein